MQSQHNNIAVITGASAGLGRALATELVHRGWTVVGTGRRPDALERVAHRLGNAFLAVPGDVTDPAHRAALARTVASFAPLQAVINNAGTLGPSPLPAVLDLDPEALLTALRSNTVAPLALVRDLAPYLAQGSAVVNVTSDAAVEAYPGWGAYGATKAALEHWTRVLAVEQTGWRVYALDPGDLRTAMQQAAFPDDDISDRPLPETVAGAVADLLEGDRPSGRYRASELALAAVGGA